MFCNVESVENRLGRPAGSSWTTADITDQIQNATTILKGELLTGNVSQDTITSWDVGEGDSAPALLQLICSYLSAAFVLEAKAGQSLSGDSRAAGLYKMAQQHIDQIRKNGTSLFESDNEPIQTADDRIRVSTSSYTPKFSVGDGDAGVAGTLDEF